MKEIKLNNSEKTTFVDDDIYEQYYMFKWYLLSNGYVCYGRGDNNFKSYERLHRIIIGAKEKDIVDHIDRNKLNNLKNNLRLITSRGNCHNRIKRPNTKNKYKGVSYVKRLNLYQSRCRMNNSDYFLGYYKTDIAAAYAYNKKAMELSKYILLNNLNDYTNEYLENLLINDRKVIKKYEGSKYKYISFIKKSGRMKENKYRIRFVINNKKYGLGNFSTEEEALIELKNNFSHLLNDIGSLK